jgi:hypothetical protein
MGTLERLEELDAEIQLRYERVKEIEEDAPFTALELMEEVDSLEHQYNVLVHRVRNRVCRLLQKELPPEMACVVLSDILEDLHVENDETDELDHAYPEDD